MCREGVGEVWGVKDEEAAAACWRPVDLVDVLLTFPSMDEPQLSLQLTGSCEGKLPTFKLQKLSVTLDPQPVCHLEPNVPEVGILGTP